MSRKTECTCKNLAPANVHFRGCPATTPPTTKAGGEEHDFEISPLGLGTCKKCGAHQTNPQWPQVCSPTPVPSQGEEKSPCCNAPIENWELEDGTKTDELVCSDCRYKINSPTHPEATGWEKEFDEKFYDLYDLGTPSLDDMTAGSETEHYENLKKFIRSLIAAERNKARQEAVNIIENHIITKGVHKECIEGLHESCEDCICSIYINKKLNQIISAITE